jgi:Peroxisomal biogenesis factor 11 (PEX11)
MTDRSPSPLPPTAPTQTQRPVSTYVSPPRRPVDAVKLFCATLLLTEGRDKVVKLLQYTSRLILLLSSSPAKRLRPLISQMSMTRKVLKLGHGVFPFQELTQGPISKTVFVRAVVEFMNDFWDDVYCLSRIGFLRSKRLQDVSEIWANRAWMMGIMMDLHVLMERRSAMARKLKEADEKKSLGIGVLENQEQKMKRKLLTDAYWIDVSTVKLLADLGFCCIFPSQPY